MPNQSLSTRKPAIASEPPIRGAGGWRWVGRMRRPAATRHPPPAAREAGCGGRGGGGGAMPVDKSGLTAFAKRERDRFERILKEFVGIPTVSGGPSRPADNSRWWG